MDARYRKNDNVVTREIAGETLLVPVHGELADMQRIFSLTGVGAFIWDRIDGSNSVADLCEGVLERFDVDAQTAEADTRALIRDLLENGLIAE